MFGSKKDFGQKLTETYQKAHAKKDIGKRLLALDELEKNLDKLTEGAPYIRAMQEKELFKGIGIGVATGAAAGAVSMDPFVSVMAALLGSIPGMIGGAVYSTAMVPWRRKVSDNKYRMTQLKKVLPFKATINTLQQQIAEDKRNIMSVDHAAELQKSSKLEVIVKKHPSLLGVFEKAAKFDVAGEIPRVAANNNADTKPQNDKQENGFSL